MSRVFLSARRTAAAAWVPGPWDTHAFPVSHVLPVSVRGRWVGMSLPSELNPCPWKGFLPKKSVLATIQEAQARLLLVLCLLFFPL